MADKTNLYTKSRLLYNRALKVLPTGVYGHLGPSNGCAIPVDAFPIFSNKAKGPYFWDVDDNKFIDYMCAYGPNILGYGDEDVDKAAIAQIRKGNCVTMPDEVLVDFAELLTDTVKKDWAFFCKNGGDVTGLAVMTARYATGRKKLVLVKGGYHGVAPWTQKVGYAGVLEEEVSNNLYVHWNDVQEFENLIKQYPGQIAAFISTPYYHPTFEDNKLPAENYWKSIRDICTKNGIVLIMDDIRCGFRLDIEGSDAHYGIKADLITFCKAIANGYSVSALCGVDSLKGAVSDVFYTGSYWLSAEPFAAGIACISKMKKENTVAKLRFIADKLHKGLKEVAQKNGREIVISGEPVMWFMRHTNDENFFMHQAWVAECVKRGIFFTNHHNQFINAALTDEDIAKTLDVADRAYKVIADKF
ncbi:MAG: aminotransferase class III-fold pyridoxal phosphate-dependent enzyme [Clostridiales bacterium]|jgi:glutamate-1-semialdehyde 2,1-aminomutase|nr:aminotransferase class III-fold pyridoxal phosphate-dependent enzyme [Clostridiales bacterium]